MTTTVVNQTQAAPVATQQNPTRLVATLAAKFGVEPGKLMTTFKQVVFRQNGTEISNEELMALAVVSNEYGLNPFLKELYAFRGKNGALMPFISVDGWLRIMNRQQDYDGMSVNWGPDVTLPGESRPLPEWCEVAIYRKNLTHPVVHREYMSECLGDSLPWKKHPRRMLKHRATIQCIRYAFGVSGSFDEESVRETEDVVSGTGGTTETNTSTNSVYPIVTNRKLETLVAKAIKTNGLDVEGWINTTIHPSQRALALSIFAQYTKPKVVDAEVVEVKEVVAETEQSAQATQEAPQTPEEDLRLEGE